MLLSPLLAYCVEKLLFADLQAFPRKRKYGLDDAAHSLTRKLGVGWLH
jgi:hypothetical protein